MKKILALLLAIIMVFAMVACGGDDSADADAGKDDAGTVDTEGTDAGDADADAGNADTGDTAGDTAGEDAAPVRAGYYDDPVDHFAREEYEFVYCFTASSALTDAYIEAFTRMQSKYNFKLRQSTGEGNQEDYIQNLEVVLDDGVDGILLDCDPTINMRVYEILEEYDTPYVVMLNPITDEEGRPLAPTVQIDNYGAAYDSVVFYAEKYKEYLGEDVELTDNVGLLNMGWSTSPPFVQRTKGATDAFLEYFPQGTVVEADGVTVGKLNAEAGYNLASQFITANPDVEYWIVFACLEDYAQGAARFSETTATPNNFLITNVGNQLLPREFAAGYRGAWYCSYGVPNVAYAGPALCGLIAMADGRATAETLWMEERIEGHSYTALYAEPVMVTIDNYDTFLDDVYALYTID